MKASSHFAPSYAEARHKFLAGAAAFFIAKTFTRPPPAPLVRNEKLDTVQVLVARAEGVMNGHYEIDEALRRIRAFDAAGADCLYVPLPGTLDDLRRVIAATAKPVNVLVAGPTYSAIPRVEYAAMGAARLSLGAALARVTHGAIRDAADAMFGTGDFSPLSKAMPGGDVNALLG